MSAKQKIVHGREPSNINLGTFVCPSDVCRSSETVPPTMLTLTDLCANIGVFYRKTLLGFRTGKILYVNASEK